MKAMNENRTIKAVAALLIIFYLLMGFVLNDTTKSFRFQGSGIRI
jgi:hypothetical protein